MRIEVVDDVEILAKQREYDGLLTVQMTILGRFWVTWEV